MPSAWIIGFSGFRRYVEFFGIFLIGGLYAINKDMVEVFVYVIGIIYNSLIYTSVLAKVPQEEFVKLSS
jgi:hypothetical protein